MQPWQQMQPFQAMSAMGQMQPMQQVACMGQMQPMQAMSMPPMQSALQPCQQSQPMGQMVPVAQPYLSMSPPTQVIFYPVSNSQVAPESQQSHQSIQASTTAASSKTKKLRSNSSKTKSPKDLALDLADVVAANIGRDPSLEKDAALEPRASPEKDHVDIPRPSPSNRGGQKHQKDLQVLVLLLLAQHDNIYIRGQILPTSLGMVSALTLRTTQLIPPKVNTVDKVKKRAKTKDKEKAKANPILTAILKQDIIPKEELPAKAKEKAKGKTKAKMTELPHQTECLWDGGTPQAQGDQMIETLKLPKQKITAIGARLSKKLAKILPEFQFLQKFLLRKSILHVQ